MNAETLILIINKKQFSVYFSNYFNLSNSSDIPALINKPSEFIWKWARIHNAKIYFEKYFTKGV